MFTFWRCCTNEDYNAAAAVNHEHSNQCTLHAMRDSEQQQRSHVDVSSSTPTLQQQPPLAQVCHSPRAERLQGFLMSRNISKDEEKEEEDDDDSDRRESRNNNLTSLLREQFPYLPDTATTTTTRPRMTKQLCTIYEPVEEQKEQDEDDLAPLLPPPKPKPKPTSGIARSLRSSVSRTAVSPPPPPLLGHGTADIHKYMRPLRKVAAVDSGLNRQVLVQQFEQQLQPQQQQHSANHHSSHSGSWISFFSMASSSNSASSTDVGTSPTWYVGH